MCLWRRLVRVNKLMVDARGAAAAEQPRAQHPGDAAAPMASRTRVRGGHSQPREAAALQPRVEIPSGDGGGTPDSNNNNNTGESGGPRAPNPWAVLEVLEGAPLRDSAGAYTTHTPDAGSDRTASSSTTTAAAAPAPAVHHARAAKAARMHPFTRTGRGTGFGGAATTGGALGGHRREVSSAGRGEGSAQGVKEGNAGVSFAAAVAAPRTDAEGANFIAQQYRAEHGARRAKVAAHGGGGGRKHGGRKRTLSTEDEEALTLRTVRQAVARLAGNGCAVGIKTQNAALSVFARASWASACTLWLKDIPANQRDVQTYNNVLLAMAKTSDVSGHQALWRELETRCTPDTRSYVTLLNRMAKEPTQHALQDIIRVLRRAQPLNLHLVNAAINVTRSADDAHSLYDRAKAHGLKADRFTVLAILNKCDGSTRSIAERVFDETTPPKGLVIPTVKEWTAFLGVYKDVGDVYALHAAWRRMAAAGVRPNEMTYATFIKGCVAVAAVKDAEEKYHIALSEHEAKQHHIHTNMMQVYAAAGDAAGAERVMKIVQGMDLTASGPLRMAYEEAKNKAAGSSGAAQA